MEQSTHDPSHDLELAPGMREILEKEYGMKHVFFKAAKIIFLLIAIAVVGIVIIFVLRAMGKN